MEVEKDSYQQTATAGLGSGEECALGTAALAHLGKHRLDNDPKKTEACKQSKRGAYEVFFVSLTDDSVSGSFSGLSPFLRVARATFLGVAVSGVSLPKIPCCFAECSNENAKDVPLRLRAPLLGTASFLGSLTVACGGASSDMVLLGLLPGSGEWRSGSAGFF